jgi:hypothetical protein
MESELEVMNYSETVTKEIVGQKSIFSMPLSSYGLSSSQESVLSQRY